MEDKRLLAKEHDIDNYYKDLANEINGMNPSFLFNLDEVGQDDWADKREQTVIVPQNWTKSTAPYALSRSGKRATALLCISGDGEWINPQIVVPRSTIDSEILSFCPTQMFQMVHTPSGYVTSASFEHWMKNVFIRQLKQKRDKYNYSDKVVVILDGYTAHIHVLQSLADLLTNEKIVLKFLVPHSSDQTQPLDLGIFGVAKGHISTKRTDSNLSAQTNQILKLLSSLWQAANPINVMSAFRAAGIKTSTQLSTGIIAKTVVEVDVGCCTKVRHYSNDHIQSLIQAHVPLTEMQTKASEKWSSRNIHAQSKRISLPKF